MIKRIIPVLLSLVLITGIAIAQTDMPALTAEPTQTPYIIYVVVTATPEPEPEEADVIRIVRPTEEPVIQRPEADSPITLVNNSDTELASSPDQITVANDTAAEGRYAGSTDELVRMVVATVMAQTSTTAGGTADNTSNTSYNSAGGIQVRNSDGTACSAGFELVSEPTYGPGVTIPRGQVFWKEWLIRNTGTCTWTPEWNFVFDSGWQIGNTRFHMNRTTAPGETLLVRLAMVPDQKQNGNYYSTYAFEAPDGTQFGKITSSYTVRDVSYFTQPTVPWDKMNPQHGREAGPIHCKTYPYCPPPKK